MKTVVLIGRIFFSLIFLMTIFTHFSARAAAYAGSKGVPAPEILVPLSGIIAAAGALSIILGYKAKTGAWLIVLFLVPVMFYMHAFWKETDPQQMQNQMAHFMKNLSMLGGALLIACFGAGPLSLDERIKIHIHRRAETRHDRSGETEIRQKERTPVAAASKKFIKEFCPFSRKTIHVASPSI